MMATAEQQFEDEPICPICLGIFNVPRQLPCAHTFCQSCLQSYITTEATKHEKLGYIECPVCKKTSTPLKRDLPITEWASIFPVDTVLQSMLPTKSKVDRVCDACNSDGVSVVAERFCTVCEEAMCGDCLKVHRKQKMTKNHTIITLEELLNNPQNMMNFGQGFTCSEHGGENVQFYCTNHQVACCGMCSFRKHKTCSKVIDLSEELSSLLQQLKPDNIVSELQKVESHLKQFIELNELNISELESQVTSLSSQISEVKRKINAALDELETRVKTEGSRIYKEEVIKKQDENHQCMSLIHAVRNSHVLMETAVKYGSDTQKFLMAEKITSQLSSYYCHVRGNYQKINTVTLQVEISPIVESILSLNSSDLGKTVMNTISKTLTTCLQKPLKDCQVEKNKVVDINMPVSDTQCSTPKYCGISFLPGGRLLLIDHDNDMCILIGPSYELITNYKLTGKACDICVVDDHKVAVTVYDKNKIQILSVKNDIISPVKTIPTKRKSYGIAASGNGEMVVAGDCGGNKYCWSVISEVGEVKSSDQYDSPSGFFNHIALDSAKTRVYVTVFQTNSFHSFNMDGKMQYTYSPASLRYPFGLALDRDDNIYIVGLTSNNIHQLSPDGSVLQIITTIVPQRPRSICFDNKGDTFIVTNDSESRKLHIYQLV